LVPGFARSSIAPTSLSSGTAMTSSLVAKTTGFSTRPSLLSSSGSFVLAAA
jgi:hypothetical protein